MTSKITAHFDALGFPVVIGKKYGWSTNSNGFTLVTIGIAEKFTEKGVTLKVESSRRVLYDNDPEILKVRQSNEDYEWKSIKSKINIRGFCLFPISE